MNWRGPQVADRHFRRNCFLPGGWATMEAFSNSLARGCTMKRISTMIALFLAVAVLTLPWTSQARAQNVLSYVAHAGSDANNCNSPATACSTFTGALAKTIDTGTISCADAGYFGYTTISKSVT